MALKRQEARTSRWKLLEKGLLVALFTLVCFVLSYSYINSTSGITILIHSHSREGIVSGKTSELLKGEKIKGEFQAKENNMGIIALRFNTFFRINSDAVIFRIKEKGAKDWYYQNSYLVNQFQPNQYFTFGFPIIESSEGKRYQFEVESTKGEPQDAVALSPIEPIFVSKYQYSKQRIFDDQKYLLMFLYKKTINSLLDINFVISLFVYALPLMLYLIKAFFFDKYLADKYLLAIIPLGLMVALSFINVPRSDEAVLGTTGLWIVLSLTYRLQSTISLVLALVFVIAAPIFLYSNLLDLSRNVAMWGFMLFVAGVLLQLVELVWKRKDLLGLSAFILPKRFLKTDKS